MASGEQGKPGLCLLTCSALVSRELLNAHKDNLGTTIKFVIFNELSNARNPNNMQILYTVLQHSSELAPKVRTLSTGQPTGLCLAEAGDLWNYTRRNCQVDGYGKGTWIAIDPSPLWFLSASVSSHGVPGSADQQG